MKNVNKENLKKCIFLEWNEYKKIIGNLFEGVSVEFCTDGIYYSGDNEDEDAPYDEEVNAALAEYFDVVAVTSVHADDCDIIGIWISYIDKE